MNKNNGNVEGEETKNLNSSMREENKDKVEQEPKPTKGASRRKAKEAPKGGRSWVSLQTSRRNWVVSSKIPDYAKKQIEELYWDNDLRAEHTPEEIYQMMLKIEVEPCPICGHKLHLNEKCSHIGQIIDRKTPRRAAKRPPEGERTWVSLQASRQRWVISTKVPDYAKKQIEELYWDDDLRAEHTPEEIYQMMLKIEVDSCPVCGHKLHLNEKCPGQIRRRKLPENPTIWQIRHAEAWTKNLVESTDYSFASIRLKKAHVKKWCEKCQDYTQHLLGVVGCMTCWNRSDKMREASRKVGVKVGPVNLKKAHAKYDGKKWCNKCKTYTMHLLGVGCMTCHNQKQSVRDATSERNRIRWATDPEFAKRVAANLGDKLGKSKIETRDNVRFYEGELCEEIVKGILNGDKNIEEYPLFVLEGESIFYNGFNILTSSLEELEGSNIVEINDVEFVNDFDGTMIEANLFFDRQIKRIQSGDLNNLIEELIESEGFKIEPVISYGEGWSRTLTDKYLCEKGYGWIVYIKLLDGKPFIVGKTGTRLVSKSEIDFNFLVGTRDKPDYRGLGREYVRRTQPGRECTDYDKVLIRGFETEEEALLFEGYIYDEYNLFMS